MEYWKKLNPDGTTRCVECHSFHHIVSDATQITKEEYDEYIASLPMVEEEPPRDLATKIVKAIKEAQSLEDLKVRIEKLEGPYPTT